MSVSYSSGNANYLTTPAGAIIHMKRGYGDDQTREEKELGGFIGDLPKISRSMIFIVGYAN